ncbi:oxidoreductase [Brevibacillus laterosporus]|uniref:Oxidoreductase n=1 Tax=Brevibacillus laterosporus TaxID=1465 RepID=A0AAP8QA92_BRELA|nr:oxidoreductase [Brevibacillus laterosporus]PPA82795.1 oxidoreductase [Brevibacillus laterosporus]PPA93310.1 oxidoreductase [Brevibacillus laterosporus]
MFVYSIAKKSILARPKDCAKSITANGIRETESRAKNIIKSPTLWLFSNIHHIFFINIVILYKIHNSPQAEQNNVKYTENIIY